MRGHIEKRGKDSYSLAISMGKDANTGKYKYQWTTVKGTKKEAEKRLSEILNQLDTGMFMRPGKTTLAEYLERWLKDYAKPNLSPRGYERYESICRVHLIPSLGNIPLTQLKPEHLQKLYTVKLNNGLSALTVRYLHTVIHKALQTALKWGLVSRNVADGVDIPRARHNDMQTWDEYDITRFLDTAKDSPYYALFHTALFTGMRRSELLALRWLDVDLLFSQVSVTRSLHHLKDGSYVFTQPKSAKSRRTISLSPSAILTLKEQREKQASIWARLGKTLTDNDLVFSTPEGKPLRPNTVSRAWAMLAARAGVKVIRFHDARHTHASLMLKQGVHPKIVQERLGHASIQITLDTYSHVAPGLQQAAAEGFDKLVSSGYNENGKNEPVRKHY
ncbi:MAG: tyrosine-type recombinase/integrase [Dehalococcoidia bacterium]|nr:tyrosine-type recombinase/integrase [Dehalococcoidia bacterium]